MVLWVVPALGRESGRGQRVLQSGSNSQNVQAGPLSPGHRRQQDQEWHRAAHVAGDAEIEGQRIPRSDHQVPRPRRLGPADGRSVRNAKSEDLLHGPGENYWNAEQQVTRGSRLVHEQRNVYNSGAGTIGSRDGQPDSTSGHHSRDDVGRSDRILLPPCAGPPIVGDFDVLRHRLARDQGRHAVGIRLQPFPKAIPAGGPGSGVRRRSCPALPARRSGFCYRVQHSRAWTGEPQCRPRHLRPGQLDIQSVHHYTRRSLRTFQYVHFA